MVKCIRSCALWVFFSVASHASEMAPNSQLRTANSSVALSAANALNLSWRCPQLINCKHGVRDRLGCTNKVTQLARASQMWSSRNYLEDDLLALASDKDAHRALRNIVKLAEDGRPFHLWNQTLLQFRGDKGKTMRFLATYFQADGFTSKHFSPEVNALKDRAYQLITPGIKSGAIQAYPDGVDIKKATIYHFYASGVIALNLRKQGVETRYAAALPLAVNEGYEYVQNTITAGARAYRGEPQKQMAYTDIYSAYAGVQFALSSDKEKFNGPQFEKWNKDYKTLGATAISNHLKNGLGGDEAFCNGVSPVPALREVTPEMREQFLTPTHLQPRQEIEK